MASVKYGVIILGNSGVGKSFLANVLLREEAFVHKFSAESVTHETELKTLIIDDSIGANVTYGVFNIPGLIENNQQRIDLNKKEIEKAFRQCPTSIIIYVFGQQNGRIRDEDVVAFNAINSAYPLDKRSLIFVVNGLPTSRAKDYEGSVTVLLQKLTNTFGISVCFLDQIDTTNEQEKMSLRAKMLQIIVDKTPQYHAKQHDIHLQLDEMNNLKDIIKNLRQAFDKQKQQFQEEIQQQQNRYNELKTQQKTETAYLQKLIEQQREETAQTRQQMMEQKRENQSLLRDVEQKYKAQMAEQKHAAEVRINNQMRQENQKDHKQAADELVSIKTQLRQAISIGAPAYNAGGHNKCYETYAATARAILSSSKRNPIANNLLQVALTNANRQNTDSDKAWTMRHAFDAILAL